MLLTSAVSRFSLKAEGLGVTILDLPFSDPKQLSNGIAQPLDSGAAFVIRTGFISGCFHLCISDFVVNKFYSFFFFLICSGNDFALEQKMWFKSYMGKTKVVLSYQRAVLRPLCLLVAKSGCDVSVTVSVCGVTTYYGNTTAFVPLASEYLLFKKCCRQGRIATTRIE